MKKNNIGIIDKLFPLLLTGLVLCGTNLYPALFNRELRWLYVGCAFIMAFMIRNARISIKSMFFKLVIIYIIWCFLTVFWSEVPMLSFYKVSAAFLVTCGLFVLGYAWMTNRSNLEDLWQFYLWLIPAVLLVALLGKGGQGLLEQGQNYFTGLTGNPNFLGWMMTLIFPPLIWFLFNTKLNLRNKLLCVSALVLNIYYLIISQSRASMLSVACVAFSYFMIAHPERKLRIIVTTVFSAFLVVMFIPGFIDIIYTKYILKGSEHNISYAWELSRQSVFEETLEGAMQGGWFGGGYGISIGSSGYGYSGGLTSIGYGREKGNSLLAVIEEIGVIGLMLVGLLGLRLAQQTRKAYRCAEDRKTRVQIALLAGFLVGQFVHSNFEAWFVAPGSSESLFIWGNVGVVSAFLARVIVEQGQQKQPTIRKASGMVVQGLSL